MSGKSSDSGKSKESWGKKLQHNWQQLRRKFKKAGHDDKACSASVCDVSAADWYEPVPFPTLDRRSFKRGSVQYDRGSVQNDETTTEVTEDDKYKISLNVPEFQAENIILRVEESSVQIECRQENLEQNDKFVSRRFVRRYLLPGNSDPDTVAAVLTSEGRLSIFVKKQEKENDPNQLEGLRNRRNHSLSRDRNVRVVPVQMGDSTSVHPIPRRRNKSNYSTIPVRPKKQAPPPPKIEQPVEIQLTDEPGHNSSDKNSLLITEVTEEVTDSSSGDNRDSAQNSEVLPSQVQSPSDQPSSPRLKSTIKIVSRVGSPTIEPIVHEPAVIDIRIQESPRIRHLGREFHVPKSPKKEHIIPIKLEYDDDAPPVPKRADEHRAKKIQERIVPIVIEDSKEDCIENINITKSTGTKAKSGDTKKKFTEASNTYVSKPNTHRHEVKINYEPEIKRDTNVTLETLNETRDRCNEAIKTCERIMNLHNDDEHDGNGNVVGQKMEFNVNVNTDVKNDKMVIVVTRMWIIIHPRPTIHQLKAKGKQ